MGHRWYAIDWSTTPPRGDPAEIAASRDLVARFLEEAPWALGTDASRAFLLGFSQGAIMSLAVLLGRPELVRGVVAHSGRLARLPGAAPDPAALSHAHALVLHGALDAVVPAELGRKAYDVLARLLGDRVAWRSFDDLDHGISAESLAETARWLTAQLDAGE
jgi:phospholipase/carboxylesterase